ncbi:MAG: PorV/PorQ family protein [bacterium]|nr:PorV/PorQ family protein [bacterium]
MKKNYIPVIIFILVLSLRAAGADPGTSAGDFLRITPGATGPALGNAVVSMDQTAEALFHNPAGLSTLDRTEFALSYSRWMNDLNFMSLAFGSKTEETGNVGLGFTGLFYGDIPVVSLDESGQLTQTARMAGAYDFAVMAAIADQTAKTFSMGITAKLIFHSLDDERSTELAIDAGTGLHVRSAQALIGPRTGNLTFGLALQNIGSKARFDSEEFDLPLQLKLGAHYSLLNLEQGIHMATIYLDAVKSVTEGVKINSGLEYGFRQIIYLRAGVKAGNDLDTYSLGAGLNVPLKSSFLKLDYAYVPYGSLAVSHQISLRFTL